MLFELAGFVVGGAAIAGAFRLMYLRDSHRVFARFYASGRSGHGA